MELNNYSAFFFFWTKEQVNMAIKFCQYCFFYLLLLLEDSKQQLRVLSLLDWRSNQEITTIVIYKAAVVSNMKMKGQDHYPLGNQYSKDTIYV